MIETIILACFMAVFTLIASWIPFSIKLRVEQLESLSYISSGIILGTAFSLVLPECYEAFEVPAITGTLIILGFMGMLLLEIFLHQNNSSSEASDAEAGHINAESETPDSAASQASEDEAGIVLKDPHTWPLRNLFSEMSIFTIGMTIHAAADGIALGVTQGNSQFIVFVAILMHKAPAAFGLTSVLLSENKQSMELIKRDAFLFSMAGPLLAIFFSITCFILGMNSGGKSNFASGCLALSGGTFVYVAIHLLQKSGKSYKKLALVAAGLIFPLLASFVRE